MMGITHTKIGLRGRCVRLRLLSAARPLSKAARTLRKATSRTSIASKALRLARAVRLVKIVPREEAIVVDVLRGAGEEVGRADVVGRVAAVADAVRAGVVEADADGSNCRTWSIKAARERSLLFCRRVAEADSAFTAPSLYRTWIDSRYFRRFSTLTLPKS